MKDGPDISIAAALIGDPAARQYGHGPDVGLFAEAYSARRNSSRGIHWNRLFGSEPCSVAARISIGEKRNEGHALASGDHWQKLRDRGLEMVGRLVRAPSGLVDVELEDKELSGLVGER
jgi:hypothetical protein